VFLQSLTGVSWQIPIGPTFPVIAFLDVRARRETSASPMALRATTKRRASRGFSRLELCRPDRESRHLNETPLGIAAQDALLAGRFLRCVLRTLAASSA
jgi:hypothetical protein